MRFLPRWVAIATAMICPEGRRQKVASSERTSAVDSHLRPCVDRRIERRSTIVVLLCVFESRR
jgi:hypothetical protein